jgi:polyhydroxyalkanoate synthesis regulator phasin
VPTIAGAQEDGEPPVAEAETDSSPTSLLDDLVEEGVITADQADIIRERFEEARAERGQRHFRGLRGVDDADVVTELLGLSEDEIREALRDGQTLAELAEARGVSEETLVDALVDEAAEHLEEHVAVGDLTEEEAAERLEHLEERITDRVNGERPEPGERGVRGPRGRFGSGPAGAEADDTAA